MMERDIRAVLNGLTLLVADTKGASQLDAMRNNAAIMALCADLRRSADEYNGTWNITMVISELENHMAAVAGLFPTWDLPTDLEFRSVVVMACDDDVIPQSDRIESVADDADLEEVYNTERHLLYVACTRARDHLLVTGITPVSEFVDDFLKGS